MLTASDIDTRRPDLRAAAARLAALAAAAAPDAQATAWQDGLDLLAVAAGVKPVCLLGRGAGDADWLDAAGALAGALGLAMLTGACWQPVLADDPPWPDWHRAAVAERDAGQHALYIWRDGAIGARVRHLCAEGRVEPRDEAALLGYPSCCVAQHHAQANAVERLTVDWVIRLADGDPARQRRLIAAGVVPTASAAADWRRPRGRDPDRAAARHLRQSLRRLRRRSRRARRAARAPLSRVGARARLSRAWARARARAGDGALADARPIDPYPSRQSRAAGRADPAEPPRSIPTPTCRRSAGRISPNAARAPLFTNLAGHPGWRAAPARSSPTAANGRSRWASRKTRSCRPWRSASPNGADRRRRARSSAVQRGRHDRRRGRPDQDPGDVDLRARSRPLHCVGHVP
ncbi:MAG: hypothetical protein WDO24_29440 [Pseudomonadota bacterium]